MEMITRDLPGSSKKVRAAAAALTAITHHWVAEKSLVELCRKCW